MPAVLIAAGKTDGTLDDPIAIPIPTASLQVHANFDYNGDDVPDIVVTDPLAPMVYVIPSNPEPLCGQRILLAATPRCAPSPARAKVTRQRGGRAARSRSSSRRRR